MRPPRPASPELQTIVAQVYTQARFRCSNPACGQWIAMEDQFMVYVDDHGDDIAENLLPFCATCYDRRFSPNVRAAWKSVQLAWDSPYDYDSFLFLAFLEAIGEPLVVDTSRLLEVHHVVVSGAVQATRRGTDWSIELTVSGQLLLESWRQGKPG